MTTRSVIVLSTCNKTSKKLTNFSVGKMCFQLKIKKESLKNDENSFLKMFKPVVESYSDRALLVKLHKK